MHQLHDEFKIKELTNMRRICVEEEMEDKTLKKYLKTFKNLLNYLKSIFCQMCCN